MSIRRGYESGWFFEGSSWTVITDQTWGEPYLMILRYRLQIVHEQLLVLWQQGEHHCQPIEDQQEAFGQRCLVWKRNTLRGLYVGGAVSGAINRILSE